MSEIDVTGLVLDDARLAEIRDLLRYESSISFHSHRAAESMWLLVAEVERLRDVVAASTPAPRCKDSHEAAEGPCPTCGVLPAEDVTPA